MSSSPENNLDSSPHGQPSHTVRQDQASRTDDNVATTVVNGHNKQTGSVDTATPQTWKRSDPLKYSMKSILQQGKALLTPRASNQSLHKSGFATVKDAIALFPSVDPAIDGEDCLHDCASCTVDLPRKWSIDEEDKLFGHVNGWESHLVVATGKTDWVRDITDEEGSVMEKVAAVSNKGKQMEYNGRKVMLSASDMPTGDDEHHGDGYLQGGRTRCLVLPGWKYVEGVSTEDVEWMMTEVVSTGASNTHPVKGAAATLQNSAIDTATVAGTTTPRTDGESPDPDKPSPQQGVPGNDAPKPAPTPSLSPPAGVNLRACPHRAIIMMCSHKTRDWRCGASAPLLRKEFERHLRPLGLYRDLHDERPGGVAIYFINHVGGHKYSANVMIYRREGRRMNNNDHGNDEMVLSDEAVQGIWLARVRPEDCENIVKYTILQGKLVKPQRQLRGGFDRESGLVSW